MVNNFIVRRMFGTSYTTQSCVLLSAADFSAADFSAAVVSCCVVCCMRVVVGFGCVVLD